jgi:hypothetical protein
MSISGVSSSPVLSHWPRLHKDEIQSIMNFLGLVDLSSFECVDRRTYSVGTTVLSLIHDPDLSFMKRSVENVVLTLRKFRRCQILDLSKLRHPSATASIDQLLREISSRQFSSASFFHTYLHFSTIQAVLNGLNYTSLRSLNILNLSISNTDLVKLYKEVAKIFSIAPALVDLSVGVENLDGVNPDEVVEFLDQIPWERIESLALDGLSEATVARVSPKFPLARHLTSFHLNGSENLRNVEELYLLPSLTHLSYDLVPLSGERGAQLLNSFMNKRDMSRIRSIHFNLSVPVPSNSSILYGVRVGTYKVLSELLEQITYETLDKLILRSDMTRELDRLTQSIYREALTESELSQMWSDLERIGHILERNLPKSLSIQHIEYSYPIHEECPDEVYPYLIVLLRQLRSPKLKILVINPFHHLSAETGAQLIVECKKLLLTWPKIQRLNLFGITLPQVNT